MGAMKSKGIPTAAIRTVKEVTAILDAVEEKADGWPPRYFSLTHAAQILGVSAECVRWYDVNGRVPLLHIAGRRVLARHHIEAIAAARMAMVRGRRKTPPAVTAIPSDHGE
jgi:hypothetical protein